MKIVKTSAPVLPIAQLPPKLVEEVAQAKCRRATGKSRRIQGHHGLWRDDAPLGEHSDLANAMSLLRLST